MRPNIWKIKGRLQSLDVDALWVALEGISSPESGLFPKIIDGVHLTIGTRDGNTVESLPLSALPELKSRIPITDGHCSVRLWHREITPGLRLELLPECYIDISIDHYRRRAALTIATVGQDSANRIAETILRAVKIVAADLPEHHKYLESFVGNLLTDHPRYERNVFLIMRFREEPPFPEIVSVLREICAGSGLNLLRADDREYTSDLWDNVMTYMYSCASAIAVFDQVNYRDFNPNVAIETGFMLATGKPVLLLKDQGIPAMPSDIVGRTYRPFNTYDPKSTLPPQLLKWICDYKLGESNP